MSLAYELIRSWSDTRGNVTPTDEILRWVEERNSTLQVSIEKVPFPQDGFWYYDKAAGCLRNRNDSFFRLSGYQALENGRVVCEQPVILQQEIGYLGIICKMIGGTLNFLMQAKIEPGNVNAIQISPTIQATKSNFTRRHGGSAPAYLEYFQNARRHTVVVDQLQSEQSSRFYKKRNRNIVLLVEDDVDALESHRWMTLGQIKELLRIDNLVNMDTRTVLSCLPFLPETLEAGEYGRIEAMFHDKALFRSVFKPSDSAVLHTVFNDLNDCKMYSEAQTRLIPLHELADWQMTDREIVCRTPYDFKVVYCNIEIEGREVRRWEQPLVEALGMAVFGIFTCAEDGMRRFLVRIRREVGCFDCAELGPVVQLEPSNTRNTLDPVEDLFLRKLQAGEGVIKDVILSEEGGRFYHEQNRNAIIEITPEETGILPEGYHWMDFATLSGMIQFNNFVNIQLRNLMSLLDL